VLLNADECQLVLVDYQERLMPVIHEAQGVLANAQRLAHAARRMQVPVWGTEQNPARLGANDAELRGLCGKTLSKMHFSAVADGLADLLVPEVVQNKGNARSLPRHLRESEPQRLERPSIVVAGCEAHVCLLQTALDLIDEEWDVWVVTDACGSRTERSRDAAFDRLAGAGAELVTTEMVAFEWLRTCEHPAFKEVHALIK